MLRFSWTPPRRRGGLTLLPLLHLPLRGGGREDLLGDGGVMKDCTVPGYLAPMLSQGDEIAISVVGRVSGSGDVFLNRSVSDPLVFRYGRGEVVRGLEAAVGSMKQGEESTFLVRGSDYG